MALLWKWKNDEGNFQEYTIEIQGTIQKELSKGNTSIKVIINYAAYILFLDPDNGVGIQVNENTSNTRDISSSVSTNDNQETWYDIWYETWQWQDTLSWKKNNSEIQLNQLNQSTNSIIKQFDSQTYIIDTWRFKQKNQATGYQRNIRNHINFKSQDNVDWEQKIGWKRVYPTKSMIISGVLYDPKSVKR